MKADTEEADSSLHDDTTAHTLKNWHVVANKSQFDYSNGRSACVAIAGEAAVKLLSTFGEKHYLSQNDIKPAMLIEIIESGISMYAACGRQGHLELDELVFHENYSCRMSLIKREQKCLKEGLEHMLFYELLLRTSQKNCSNSPAGILIVKGGEAALIVISKNGRQVLIFNSHPKTELNPSFSKCFVSASCDDLHQPAGFLSMLFPCVGGLGFGIQADMYNMFDIAVIKLPKDVVEGDLKEENVSVRQQVEELRHGSSDHQRSEELTPDLQFLVSQGIISREAALGMM